MLKQSFIEKEFNRVRNKILEGGQTDNIASDLTDLEFKMIRLSKDGRDKIRKLLESLREKYRPIRAQVDDISRAASEIEKFLAQ